MSEENTQTQSDTQTPPDVQTNQEASAAPKTTSAAVPNKGTAPHRATASRGAKSPRSFPPRGIRPAGAQGAGQHGTSSSPFPRSTSGGRPPRRGPGGDKGRATFQDRKPEFEQKIISIRRVTRVVSGGRRLSFAVSMVIGDKKGSMGVGTGKAVDTALAIAKALKSARKNLIKLKLTKNFSIPYDVEAKYATSRITLAPNKGKGLVAGSAARDLLKLGGLKDVTAKYHSGSKNKLNNARVALLALSSFAQKGARGFQEEVKAVDKEVGETMS